MTEQARPSRVQQVVATFDAVAPDYDQGGVAYFGPIADLLVEAVAPRPGERALDIGSGRGAVTMRLAAAVRPGGHVVGIDLSTGMLRALRADLDAAGYGEVELLERDASDPGGDPASYDLVTASLVIFFLPDPLAALRAWRDLVRPGGRMAMTTFGTRDEVWSQIDRVFERYLSPAVLDGRTSGRHDPFASPEATSALVAEAGFEGAVTREVTLPITFASTDQWHDWSWTVGSRALWLAVPEHERPAVRARIVDLLTPLQRQDGSLVVDQTVRVTTARRV